ncbi:MAG TPA: 2-phosphoglycerate kinase [Oceanithermus profundus]|uniref:2-phosphoglycerate kinase n=1 Tax=Oceanithermus profundus TaxID=187137 RepID=A0A7C4ZRC6_9DEIN|nr:2-phosphoglycerate kinase [Oceanithermus profundus]
MPEIYVTTPRGLRWPFSKGLVIESLVSAGVDVQTADEIAHAIERELRARGVSQIASEELKRRMTEAVAQRMGREQAERVARQTQSFEEILVTDEHGERPFSKGLLVRSLEEAGFSLREAHELAKQVEQRLRQAGKERIEAEELEDFVARVIREAYGKEARKRYQKRLEYGGGVFVVEEGGEPRVPFSKGILAQSLMAAGLTPDRAYRLAREVERELIREGRRVVGRGELRGRVAELLERRIGEEVAERYRVLRAVRRLERPMHILIGGVSGVGKSTLAAALAYRLGITRMTSSDSVREILRATTTRDLVPTLHTSSFNAWKALVEVLGLEGEPSDEVILQGFRDQVARVSVGIRAIQERNARERTSVVIEGVHVVPGFLNHPLQSEVVQIPMLVVVRDEELHKGRFRLRERETGGRRPVDKYLAHFDALRMIQDHLEALAQAMGVPVIPGDNLDKAVEKGLEVITERFHELFRAREHKEARA